MHLSELIYLLHCELLGAEEGVVLLGPKWEVVGSVGITVGIDHFTNVRQRFVLNAI